MMMIIFQENERFVKEFWRKKKDEILLLALFLDKYQKI